MAKVCPLFSGSSGNSYYIGTGGAMESWWTAGRTAKADGGGIIGQ